MLQTDTDVVWLANPYPALKQVYGQQQIVAMQDRPMINAGVFYVQNVKQDDGAAWMLRELARRIHLFILHPEAVGQYIPWAQASTSARRGTVAADAGGNGHGRRDGGAGGMARRAVSSVATPSYTSLALLAPRYPSCYCDPAMPIGASADCEVGNSHLHPVRPQC